MKYVVDSSVAFKWCVPEVDTAKAVRLRDDFRAGVHELLAPDVFPVELAHALTRTERQGRLTVGESVRLLTDVLKALPDQFPSLSLLPRACQVSSATRIGIYDCLYVALAEHEGCELVTADDRLVKNLRAALPYIAPLSSLP
jgi:predicted nucleic acid-binding protein